MQFTTELIEAIFKTQTKQKQKFPLKRKCLAISPTATVLEKNIA